MSILIFLLVLIILIVVHEWGHMYAAKKTGMRVDEFGVGFPPKLYGVRIGETEYTINVFPIGGFVRIFGDGTSTEEITKENFERTFGGRPRWAQAIVLAAGVIMNILFAWFLFVLTFLIGIPTAVDEAAATPAARLMIESVLPSSPAAEMLKPGAVITAAESETRPLETLSPSAFTNFVVENGSAPMTVTYELGGDSKTVEVVPKAGVIATDLERVALGVSLVQVETIQYDLWSALVAGTSRTIEMMVAISYGLFDLLRNALTGSGNFEDVAGPVGIVSLVGDAAAFGFTALLSFTAIISLNLAIVNLLPIPALDGGRLLFLAIEAVTRREINPIWMARVNTVGFILLIALMIAITVNDVSRLF